MLAELWRKRKNLKALQERKKWISLEHAITKGKRETFWEEEEEEGKVNKAFSERYEENFSHIRERDGK